VEGDKTVQKAKTTPETGKCRIKYETTIPDATADDKIETVAKAISEKTMTGTTTRRGSSTGTTSSSQSTTTCPSTGCGTGAAAASAAGQQTAVKISQSIQFTSLSSASEWNGNIKNVGETGYGIGLGIYDTTAKAYRASCSVTSSASRRAVTVSFAATVSATWLPRQEARFDFCACASLAHGFREGAALSRRAHPPIQPSSTGCLNLFFLFGPTSGLAWIGSNINVLTTLVL